jgi:hypothetical protein
VRNLSKFSSRLKWPASPHETANTYIIDISL